MHKLRDLANKIYVVTSSHEAFALARTPVNNLIDQLQAMAAYHEGQQRESELQRQLAEANEVIRMLKGS